MHESRRAPYGGMAEGRGALYRAEVCEALENHEWDCFLARVQGGHHVQTSQWARVQAQFGWRPIRVLIYEGDALVAGVQILTRSFGAAGSVGNAIRGPVLAHDDIPLARQMVDRLNELVRSRRIRHLILQPATEMSALQQHLSAAGFRPSSLDAVLQATVLVDLSVEPETLLGRMHGKTRYNIRLAERKGVVVREGTADDLGTFHRLLVATSERQQFATDSAAYFTTLWNAFAPSGQAKLFLAESEGEALSAFLYIGFGDTLVYKRGAWSGRHSSKHPNELLHWRAITWAQAQGYRKYDFDGISLPIAQAALMNQALSAEQRKSVAAFKLGFGGDVVLLPRVYEQIRNPALRWGYYALFPHLKDLAITRKLLRLIRSRMRQGS